MKATELLPIRAARYVGRRTTELAHFMRGKNILRRYRAHHRRAQSIYRALRPTEVALRLPTPGVRVIRPDDDLVSGHAEVIEHIARQAARLLETPSTCRFVPPLPSPIAAATTSEIEAVRRGEVLAVQVRDPLAIDGLNTLAEPLTCELERTVYRSFALVDKVYVYRSIVSAQAPRGSWLWHYDNHPPEIVKALIYLTDVDESSAPFEYLRDRDGGAVVGAPITPRFGHGRVSDDIVDQVLAAGGRRCIVTGPRGTTILFDDNVLHRATVATGRHRDVLTFQVRPWLFQVEPRIDRRWTGSFPHWDIQDDPWVLAPRLNSGRL